MFVSDFWFLLGLSVFVDDEAKEEKSFYFLGVLPHSDSLKELMKDIEEPILPGKLNCYN